jgi:hypothetical protein
MIRRLLRQTDRRGRVRPPARLRLSSRLLGPAPLALLLGLALVCGLALAPSAGAAGSGLITGTVTDTSAAPIAGIEVCASEKGSESFFGLFGGCATTNAAGEYTLSGLTKGEYVVEFLSPAESGLDYVTQYYRNRSSYSEAEAVTVREGETTKEIDAELQEGGRISGRVTDATTRAPLAGILVCALSRPSGAGAEELEVGGCAQTGAGGEYTILALAAGEYTVGFTSALSRQLNYVTQYYSGASAPAEARLVRVTLKNTTPDIDAALAEAGWITGTVTAAANGAGLEGVLVCALTVSGASLVTCEATEPGGTYTLHMLPAGEYKVSFRGPTRYLKQYYNDRYTLAEAQAVPVAAAVVTPAINAALELGPPAPPKNTAAPTISGTLTAGSALSCATGAWSGAPAPQFSYAWLRDGAAIPGAGTSGYLVQRIDEGHTIACQVTASNALGTLSATSLALGIELAPPPPPVPHLSLAAAKLRVARNSVVVRLTCSDAAPCAGTAALTVQVLVRSRRGRRTVSRRQTLVLAKGSFSLKAGQTASVALRLTALGRQRLAHAQRHPLAAHLALSVKGARATAALVRVS